IGNAECLEAARTCAQSYRERMRSYSCLRHLDVWYSRVDAEAVLKVFHRSARAELSKELGKARRRNSLQALSKLASLTDGRLRIVDDPPLVSHVDDDRLGESLRRFFAGYHSSLQDDRRTLAERYRFVDFALKVGSVGTPCYVLRLGSSHHEGPLFLQIKQATASVLEPHVGRSKHRNHGQRVVSGQRLLQSASDIFLGWSSDGENDYYIRQLRDMK